MLVSVVIRTLNEETYLRELLTAIHRQEQTDFSVEVVIVDSGSTDRTLEIAESFGARITTIQKSGFTFGRSLNLGCDFANGDIFVLISGHCIPVNNDWLANLIAPLMSGDAGYSYGRQRGRNSTKYSERQLFDKYFPASSRLQTEEFFCNNANSAILKSVWEKYSFNEEVTGLEDMYLSKQYVADRGVIAYVAEAPVFHIHNESWSQTKRRYEREALALQVIMPEVHVSLIDTIRYISSAIRSDFVAALRERVLIRYAASIVSFRFAQYAGSFLGNKRHRKVSQKRKESYFYPTEKVNI
jgi:rhamnosyltransferase